MAGRRLRASVLLLALLAPVALAGCTYQSETTYQEDGDGCWMFCGDTRNEYSWGFVWFPFLGLLTIVLIIVVIVVAVNTSQRPPQPPPPQQQVVVHTRDGDDEPDDP